MLAHGPDQQCDSGVAWTTVHPVAAVLPPPHPAVARPRSLNTSFPVVSNGAHMILLRRHVGGRGGGAHALSRLDGGRRMFRVAGLNGQGFEGAGGWAPYLSGRT